MMIAGTLLNGAADFTQTQPVENKPPSQETAFKILYDNDNLYVFIRAYDTEPDKISKIMSRRDNFSGDMVWWILTVTLINRLIFYSQLQLPEQKVMQQLQRMETMKMTTGIRSGL